MSMVSALLGFIAIIAAIYASLAERDEAAIISTSVALTSLALIMLDMGAYIAAIMQVSLVAGFTAAMMFLAPRLGGKERGTTPPIGVFAAIVIILAFVVISPHFSCISPSPISKTGAVLVSLASVVVLVSFLIVRILIRRGDLV